MSKSLQPVQLFRVVRDKPTSSFSAWFQTATVLEPIRLKKNSKIKHGAECGFLVKGNGTGIKTFYSSMDARYSHKLQKKAYRYKVAPKVLSKIFPVVVSSWRYEMDKACLIYKYAYETEVAKEVRVFRSGERDCLDIRLSKAGIDTSDVCECNAGRINDQIVAIDFGKLST